MSFYVELCCFVVAPNVCQGTLMGLMDLWTIRKPKHKCHPVLIVSTTSCWAFGMVCFDETISTNWSRKGPRLFEPLGLWAVAELFLIDSQWSRVYSLERSNMVLITAAVVQVSFTQCHVRFAGPSCWGRSIASARRQCD